MRKLAFAIVIFHLIVTVPHSIAHTKLHIDMVPWQNVYIMLVILLGPIIAALLIWRYSRIGFFLLTVTMAGSFLFGLYYHFIAPGPDNVASVGVHPWAFTFKASSVFIALTELAGTIIGGLGWKQT